MPHAFKDLIIHEIPQFILHIAVRYVLHHYSSQDIHHCKILEDSEISEKCFVKCWKRWWGRQKSPSHHRHTWANGFYTVESRVTVALDAKIMIWVWILRIYQKRHTLRANDPSAGSPTETLLRLLLPLNVKVYSTFRKERRNCKPRSPKYSPEHSIGRSDGRCVQRAGT